MDSTEHTYRGWHIHYDPPPIPVRNCDWQFTHDDFDGAEDAGDSRCGSAESLEAAKAEIDEREGGPIHPALENLRACQRQLDADGCEVGVSRQAVDETLSITHALLAALREALEYVKADRGEFIASGCVADPVTEEPRLETLDPETAGFVAEHIDPLIGKLEAAIAQAEGRA